MMKSLWNSFKIAFAMFSKIPMPQADWSEENMRYMLCFFPFVGAAVGVVMLGMEWLCRYFGMSNGFIAVALVLVPVIVTGGIHVDGLLYTSDALSSWRDREKRLEILKDSHAAAICLMAAVKCYIFWQLVIWCPDVCRELVLLLCRKQMQAVQWLNFHVRYRIQEYGIY